MYRLYEKNEINFALVWIAIYCGVTMGLRDQLGDQSIFLFVGLGVLASAMGLWIKKYNLREKYGLAGFPGDGKRYLYFIPMWLLATGNLWNGVQLSYTGLAQLWATLSMVLIGYLEEVIFRGFLFRALLAREGAKKSIIIVAVTFGIGHILNLFAGQASLETLAQIIFAVAWGFMFTITVYKSKSLWPCILIHGFINASSKFAIATSSIHWPFIIASIVTAVLYSSYLLKLPDHKTSRLE